MSDVAIVWFRRDLRLDANPAWAAATAQHDAVLPVVVLEPALLDGAGELRRNAFLDNVAALDQSLQTLGGTLTIRQGPASAAVPALADEINAAAVYRNADYGPYGRRRDAEVDRALTIPVHEFDGNVVHPPGAVLTAKGTLSQVFTPFYKRWAATHLMPWPEPDAATLTSARSDPLPPPSAMPLHTGGEDAAWKRLSEWVARVADYPQTRDLPGVAGTSELSADLKFGTIAARTVLDVLHGVDGAEPFIRQLAWRDWWAHTLAETPTLATQPLRPDYSRIAWRNDADELAQWQSGQTGYPIVDAGMRQLATTGWMHNRVRMICASFLVKDLLIDWRLGEQWFRQQLIDADLAQNAGNWQWVAGTGPDAAPYFRIFNPTAQSRKFDPHGDYIRRFVPELASLSSKLIHEPSTGEPLELAAVGVILGDTYPAPMVDHATAREATLSTYKRALSEAKIHRS